MDHALSIGQPVLVMAMQPPTTIIITTTIVRAAAATVIMQLWRTPVCSFALLFLFPYALFSVYALVNPCVFW
jgi:hypothetical protein